MNLPDGVSYHWRRRENWKGLITEDGEGLIRINNNSGYEIKDHLFEQAITPFLKGDWNSFDRRFKLKDLGLNDHPGVVYSRAEHKGDPMRPNVTVVPNLPTEQGFEQDTMMVFGCMGHYHPNKPPAHWVQEVYEFQSYGLMVLDRGQGEIELWVAQDGDKIAVPNRCHMTLYNLGGWHDPLITLDFANPKRTPPDDETMVGHIGPPLLIYRDGSKVIFQLNQSYINNSAYRVGVRLSTFPGDVKDRQVRIPVGTRLTLGRHLYEQLTRNPDVIYHFARLGIRVRLASPEAVLEPLKASNPCSRLYFSLPLVEATTLGTKVYCYFRPGTEAAEPEGAETDTPEVEIQMAEVLLGRPREKLVVLVEGAGDWVTKAFRTVFLKKWEDGANLMVYYADDSRWKGRPAFVAGLEDGQEKYLDKADPDDLTFYEKLQPHVVFIVTPDFTHSDFARRWVGIARLIFVEKPFDSNLDNVDHLLKERGKSDIQTWVRGLDHYRSYAIGLRSLLPTIEDHLGGCLRRTFFYMVEDKQMDQERLRTLQHGLTLDLLPHLPALLTYFGDIGTIDEIGVVKAGQYRPLPANFRNETASWIEFTFQDYSGNGFHVPCRAVVGKGFSQEVKYLEIVGKNSNAVRIDLGKERPEESTYEDVKVLDPYDGQTELYVRKFRDGQYHQDNIFFLQDPCNPVPSDVLLTVLDPYDNHRTLHIRTDLGWTPLDRGRYAKLVDDLLNGTNTGLAGTFSLERAQQIVQVLDRIWNAVQGTRTSWETYDLNSLDPIRWR